MANYDTLNSFSVIQTFYADPEIVKGSSEVALTSVSLYFKAKPDANKNASGKTSPGVSIMICEVKDDSPDISRCFQDSLVTVPYERITSFADASSATVFGFKRPLKLPTGRFYGVVVIFEDPGFALWTNKQGDRLAGTNTPSGGSNLVKDGKMFNYNNSGVFKALSDSDLKFQIGVAKYSQNTATAVFTNKAFEFFTVRDWEGDFIGGENVFKKTTNVAGDISFTSNSKIIKGSGTDFTTLDVGTKIGVYGNVSQIQIMTVNQVVNTTYMTVDETIPFTNSSTKFFCPPVGKVLYKDKLGDKLFLTDSTANSTVRFVPNDTLYGDDSNATGVIVSIDEFSADVVKINSDVLIPSSGKISANVYFTSKTGANSYAFTTSNVINPTINDPYNIPVDKWNAYVISRSEEVLNANLYSNTDLLINRKSMRIDAQVSVNSTGDTFYSPTIKNSVIDVYTTRYNINPSVDALDANNVLIDTEVSGNGLALTRHISKKLNFANNKFAEDLRVYLDAYRPAGTDIKVYARFHNSVDYESFDDKAWTPLEYKENKDRYSSSIDKNDIVEYTFGPSQYIESANVIPGSFTSIFGNNIITASGSNPTTFVAPNDMVKLYNPLVPENYMISSVMSANSTTITLNLGIDDNNVAGTGMRVDRLKYSDVAYNNAQNDNVVRYWTSSLARFDKFDSVQIKIVLLADTTYLVPQVDYYRVIGVSA